MFSEPRAVDQPVHPIPRQHAPRILAVSSTGSVSAPTSVAPFANQQQRRLARTDRFRHLLVPESGSAGGP
jgi:hypothetical protein